MDRICPICQTLTYDDELVMCDNCGAELPIIDDDVVIEDEEIDDLETLDLGELDLDDLGDDIPPTEPDPVEDDDDEGLVIDLEEESSTPDDGPEDEDLAAEDTGDWDTGAIGGDITDESLTVDDDKTEAEDPPPDEDLRIIKLRQAYEAGNISQELFEKNLARLGGENKTDDAVIEEEVEDEIIELQEGQLLCPSCDEIVDEGVAKCPNCSHDLSHAKPCPSCAKAIDKLAEICPHCYTDLNTFVAETPAEEEPEEDEPDIVDEPAPEEAEDEDDIDADDISEDEPEDEPEDEDPATEDTPEDGDEKKSSRWGGKKDKKEKKKKGKKAKDDEQKEDDALAEAEEEEKKEDMKRDRKAARRRDLEKKEEVDDILKEEKQEGFFNYYNLSIITLFFYVFLAIFVLMEFILMITNMTNDTGIPSVSFSLVPTFGNVFSIPILLLSMVLSMSSAALHFWDRKINLIISLVPSGLMAAGLSIDVAYSSQFLGGDLVMIIIVLFLLLFMIFLDVWLAFFKYPEVLADSGRNEFEVLLETEEEIGDIQQKLEEEYETMIQEEEEKLRLKDEEIDDIQTELESLSNQIQQEEEKLRMKEEEVSAIRSELELKTQYMAEEEEKLRMKEEEMESLIQTELEKRQDDMMMEEEEKLKIKEEELISSRSELEMQKNLLDDNREKLRLKEQEMMNLRTELESQMRHRMDEEDRLKIKEAASKMLDRGKQKRVLFPFTAMVGQEKMKRALTLNAIYPEIGGVLIRGQKGTGKSVSVRGLAEILPDIEVTGCKFNCDPADPEKFCTECTAASKAGNLRTHTRQVQVVDLPLNVTEDRLVGSIDIEKVLTEGVKSFEPGILAEAHRGVLYVDEINLLDDYIVDILLDAAGSGVVTIEREGISLSHPSRFIIVGSMNPEEGELRPQILDRIALQTDVIGIKDVAKRIDIVKRREAFTSDPLKFREEFEPSRVELVNKIDRANGLIPKVTTSDRMFKLIAQVCLDFNVDGHRADIIIERAARANAAFEGRMETTTEDIVAAASMALPHRMKRRGFEDDEEFSEEMLRKLVDKREAEME